MAQNNQPQRRQQSPTVPELTPEILQGLLERDRLRLENEAKKIAFDEKKLEYDCRIAEQAMQHNAEYQKNKPNETRKTFTRVAYLIITIVVIFLGFIGYLVMNDKTTFVNDFLHGLSYLATSLASYWVGTKNKSNKKLNSTESEIIEAESVP